MTNLNARAVVREVPKVALLVETSRGFGREFLLGIARYSRLHGPWSFHITPGDYKQVVPQMKQWGGTGIIARIADGRVAQAVLDANVPTIAIGLTDEQMEPANPLSKFSEISSDPDQVARQAADHLIERRFRHFAYVGSDDRGWSNRRENAFKRCLAESGREPLVYPTPKLRRIVFGSASRPSWPNGSVSCRHRSACSLAMTTAGAKCSRPADWPG